MDEPKKKRVRRAKPGTRTELLKELWHALKSASSLLDSESADTRLRAVHATSQAGLAYAKVLGDGELEQLVAELERRADRNKL
jgi:hypothetical protein